MQLNRLFVRIEKHIVHLFHDSLPDHFKESFNPRTELAGIVVRVIRFQAEQRNVLLEDLAGSLAALAPESMTPLDALVELDRLRRAAAKALQEARQGKNIS